MPSYSYMIVSWSKVAAYPSTRYSPSARRTSNGLYNLSFVIIACLRSFVFTHLWVLPTHRLVAPWHGRKVQYLSDLVRGHDCTVYNIGYSQLVCRAHVLHSIRFKNDFIFKSPFAL